MIKSNKGFTLIELIATISIMLIIVSIAIPSTIKFVSNGKDKEYDLIVDKIEVAAQQYYRENDVSGNKILLSEIINYIDLDEKYLTSSNKIKDPRDNNKCLSGCIKIITPNLNTLDKVEFEYEESTENCS